LKPFFIGEMNSPRKNNKIEQIKNIPNQLRFGAQKQEEDFDTEFSEQSCV
jgi:hypothetical protein